MKSSNPGHVRTFLSPRLLAACITLLLVLTLMGASASVQASQRFATSLNGAQETPPNGSAGTGYGSVILSDDQTTITVNLGFAGLGSNANEAHIHNGAPGVPGPIIFPLAGVPIATGGTFSQQTFLITPGQVTDLQNGLFYFNIHSDVLPGGEIRGQILLCFRLVLPQVRLKWKRRREHSDRPHMELLNSHLMLSTWALIRD